MLTLPLPVIYKLFAAAAWLTVKAALFPAVNPPEKVDVAVVEVAKIAAKDGVVVPTMLPEEFVERIILFPTLARLRIVPASKVRVPEVKLSEVSDLRKERESMPSKVAASPPLLDRQVPEGIWKQPADNLNPLAKVDVAEVEVIFSKVDWIPPEKVEVPTVPEETVIGPWNVEVAPLPKIVVVEVLPTYSPSIDDSRVEDADPRKS